MVVTTFHSSFFKTEETVVLTRYTAIHTTYSSACVMFPQFSHSEHGTAVRHFPASTH